MTTTVGTMTRRFHVRVERPRDGWRRLLPRRTLPIGTMDLELPVHAEATDGGGLSVTVATSAELIHALAEGLRELADDADRIAAEEVGDGR